MKENKPKPWYKSKTLWGVGLVLAATVVQLFGFSSDSACTACLSHMSGDVPGWALPVAQLIGAGFAAFGRVVAKSPIR